jgi:hypothetical protein
MPDPVCARCGFAVTRWQHAASCKVEEKNPLKLHEDPTEDATLIPVTKPVTPIEKPVTRNTPKRGPQATYSTPAERQKAYRERKATIVVEAPENALRRLD